MRDHPVGTILWHSCNETNQLHILRNSQHENNFFLLVSTIKCTLSSLDGKAGERTGPASKMNRICFVYLLSALTLYHYGSSKFAFISISMAAFLSHKPTLLNFKGRVAEVITCVTHVFLLASAPNFSCKICSICFSPGKGSGTLLVRLV